HDVDIGSAGRRLRLSTTAGVWIEAICEASVEGRDPMNSHAIDDIVANDGNGTSAGRRLGTNRRRLSILYVSARYPPFVGGTEIHTAEVARRMAERGHDVTVLTTAFEPLPTGEEFVDGVRVVRVRAWPADYDLYFAPA